MLAIVVISCLVVVWALVIIWQRQTRREHEKTGENDRPSWRNIVTTKDTGYKPAPVSGSLTTDRTDPELGVPEGPGQQNKRYLVLSEEERAKGLIRPVRQTYIHRRCGVATKMGLALAETYACKPTFYSGTWCEGCKAHLPVAEFVWEGTNEQVGS